MLTQKQESFCLNILNGMTQREAWTQAGYSSKYDVAIIDVHACALAAQDKIKIRMNELRDQAASTSVMTVQERFERLSEFARENIRSKHGVIRTSNIQAMAELSKMKGDYAPEKHKIELDLPINITYKLKDRPAIEVEKK